MTTLGMEVQKNIYFACSRTELGPANTDTDLQTDNSQKCQRLLIDHKIFQKLFSKTFTAINIKSFQRK